MDFGANKTPVGIIKEGAFRGTYFREEFIPVLMVNGIESHGKNLTIILFHLKLDRFYYIGIMN